jgi:CDP-diacylglycerol--glycerol-3-phosphate 3-phosphatidyltransferase
MVTFPAIIVSDVMDGYLARKLNCTSITGAKLDVIADGVYVISSIATFAYFQVVPAWFVLVIVLKLSDFVITSRIMRDRKKTDSVLFFDKLGIFAIRAVMLLPGVFVFRCVIAEYALVMNITTYVLTAMIVVSSWRRMTVVFGKNKV